MSFSESLKDIASTAYNSIKEKNEEIQNYYDKYYNWASRQRDDNLIEAYKRRKKNGCSSLREKIELRAYYDVLCERGYGN